MGNGWIKFHRKLLEWEWWEDHNAFRVFTYLLLVCNFKVTRWRGVELKPGETVKKIETIEQETGLSTQQVRTAICNLKSTGELTQRKHGKYRILKLKNYTKYQAANSETTVKQQRNNNEITTDKERKEIKKEKNKSTNVDICVKILKAFNSLTGKKYRMTKDKRKQIKARLESFSEEDIKQAIQNRLGDPNSMGKNKGGKIWAYDWDSLFRNDANMDRALNLQGTVVKDDKFYIDELNSLKMHKFCAKYGDHMFAKYSDHYNPAT